MDFVFRLNELMSFSAKGAADLLFFIAAFFAAVVSLVLFYHWRRYGFGGAALAITELVYLTGSVLLLSTAFFALQ
jgi:hypothetical protein